MAIQYTAVFRSINAEQYAGYRPIVAKSAFNLTTYVTGYLLSAMRINSSMKNRQNDGRYNCFK